MVSDWSAFNNHVEGVRAGSRLEMPTTGGDSDLELVEAQFPWESAWLDDGEVTPEYMGTDIVTGQLIKVWTGFIEIHITADVAYGVWQYYMCTGDQEFMDKYGYELMLDCAKFWSSRLEPGADGQLHINDVVGPDEYKEHVNDNAYTNYLVWWTLDKAIEYSGQLGQL